MTKVILFLAANPRNTGRIELDKEAREIEEGLQRALRRDEFSFKSRFATRAEDIRRHLLELNPQIVHFSGHGTAKGGVVVEGDDDAAQLIPIGALSELLSLFSSVDCVLLNACYSDSQAEAIAQHVQFVIGMEGPVDDLAARKFAIGFYDALGAGRTIDDAYSFARNAIQLANLSEHAAPILKKIQGEGGRRLETFEEPEDQEDREELMREVRSLMGKLIPNFDQSFPVDAPTKLVSEIRNERIFQLNRARALVFGETGVGKTTTINFLLSDAAFPTTGELSCTESIACVEFRDGIIFYDSPGLRDAEALENITRVALGVDQLEDEPIETVSLLDLTSDHLEGPSNFSELSYSQFQDQVSAEYYQRNPDRIVGKMIDARDFSNWAIEHFDFLIFVTSSVKGLPVPITKLLRKVDEKNPARLFKVFNVFDGEHTGSVENLASGIRRRYDQAVERSRGYGEDWLCIDSSNGSGIDTLIQALADALPADVLRSLERVIRQEHVHLIHARLASVFFDYVSRVASIVAVFPVDHQTQQEELIQFATNSIITMAEFLLPTRERSVPTKLVDQLISRVQDKKTDKKKYSHRYQNVKKPTGTWVVDAWRDFWGTHETERKFVRTYEGTFTDIGGFAAIKLALSLGLALHDFYLGKEEAVTKKSGFRKRIQGHKMKVARRLDRLDRHEDLSDILDSAREKKKKRKRLKKAEKLYPYLRKALPK